MKTESLKRIGAASLLGAIFLVTIVMLGLALMPAHAQGLQPVPPIIADIPPAPPLSSVGQLFTPDIILSLVFLLTLPLTTLVGTVFKLEGATASIVANVMLNMLAKGVILVSSQQATVFFAAIATIIGIVLDKSIYDLLIKPKAEKIVTLEAKLVTKSLMLDRVLDGK